MAKGTKALERAKAAAAAARRSAAAAREGAKAAVAKARMVGSDERVKAGGLAIAGGAASGLLTSRGILAITVMDPDGPGGDPGIVLPSGAIGGAALMALGGKKPALRALGAGMLAHAAGSLAEDLADLYMNR
jgi:hypothetical protein